MRQTLRALDLHRLQFVRLEAQLAEDGRRNLVGVDAFVHDASVDACSPHHNRHVAIFRTEAAVLGDLR